MKTLKQIAERYVLSKSQSGAYDNAGDIETEIEQLKELLRQVRLLNDEEKLDEDRCKRCGALPNKHHKYQDCLVEPTKKIEPLRFQNTESTNSVIWILASKINEIINHINKQ